LRSWQARAAHTGDVHQFPCLDLHREAERPTPKPWWICCHHQVWARMGKDGHMRPCIGLGGASMPACNRSAVPAVSNLRPIITEMRCSCAVGCREAVCSHGAGRRRPPGAVHFPAGAAASTYPGATEGRGRPEAAGHVAAVQASHTEGRRGAAAGGRAMRFMWSRCSNQPCSIAMRLVHRRPRHAMEQTWKNHGFGCNLQREKLCTCGWVRALVLCRPGSDQTSQASALARLCASALAHTVVPVRTGLPECV
jgi:hypothetical protein